MATDPYDLAKSFERLGDRYVLTVPLGDATLAAQDYLGSTSDDEGIPVPSSTLEQARVTLDGSNADDGNTTVQIDNETQDNNHSFDLDADSWTTETGIGLNFSEGDEVSVSVTSVNTPGDGISMQLIFDVNAAPMN